MKSSFFLLRLPLLAQSITEELMDLCDGHDDFNSKVHQILEDNNLMPFFKKVSNDFYNDFERARNKNENLTGYYYTFYN